MNKLIYAKTKYKKNDLLDSMKSMKKTPKTPGYDR